MQKPPVCPYLEKGYARCADRLNLESLTEAFTYCAGDYADCPVYHQIRIENEESARDLLPARTA